MPKTRQPREIWQDTRERVYQRDGGICQHCDKAVTLYECNIDHIKSGKLSGNEMTNLRTLCKTCHCLRADNRHRGMTAKAIKDGIIPYNWRELVWD
jgi:5-methylcytosine-specific restriction endonuclease McrA